MTRQLKLAFYGEGRSDYRFFLSLIRRTAQAICTGNSGEIDVEEIIELYPEKESASSERQRILYATRPYEGWFDILLIHADAGGSWEAAQQNHIEPVTELVTASIGCPVVGIIPVREMEAWALVDGETLRNVFQTNKSNVEMGIPARPRLVETKTDPKALLENAYQRVLGERVVRRRGERQRGTDFLGIIGQSINLQLLHQVPSFQRFEADLRSALVKLGYIN